MIDNWYKFCKDLLSSLANGLNPFPVSVQYKVTIVGEDGQPKQKSFRALLLTKCQQEFEKDKKEDEHLEQLKAAVVAAETVSGWMGVCMHACVHVCMGTCMHACVYACEMHGCSCECMYLFCICVCIHMYMCAFIVISLWKIYMLYVCMHGKRQTL